MYSLFRIPALFFALILFVSQPVNGQVINEFQASNAQTIADEDGSYEDWIEIYNHTQSPINLFGYGLSDDVSRPFRWVFPEITIQPNAFLLVWASGKNRAISGSELHTNFRISASGEQLFLTRPDGVRVDEMPSIDLPTDISFGRKPNGSDQLFYFKHPTPALSNATTGYEGVATAPEFSYAGGLYAAPFVLSMQAQEGAQIRFTHTPVAPTAQTGNVYINPIYISNSGVIRAVAFKDNYIPSAPATIQYVRMASTVQGFSSNLPLVVLNQYHTPVTSGDRVPVSFYFLEENLGSRTSLSGGVALQSLARANYRGSSSLSFPKKMYGFHLLNEEDRNRNEEIFGLPPDHNWILNGPYSDKSLMRNVISYRLAESLGWYAPRTQFVELFVHNGTGSLSLSNYHGVYVLMERIKWGEHRVNIAQIEQGDNTEPNVTGGYIIKKDRLNEGQSGFTTTRGTKLAFVRPQEEDITQAQKNWIRTYMSNFETALFSSWFADPVEGYQAYIDTDSFIDHFIITELMKEIDGYRLSTYMYKDRNAKLVMGPVWDFNLSLGNGNYIEGYKPEGWYIDELAKESQCYIGCGIRDWYLRLLQDEHFVDRLQFRWWSLRQEILSDETLSQTIADNKAKLDEAQARNFQRWTILGQYVWPNYFIADTWEEELEWMENFLLTRAHWIDNQMGERPEFKDFFVHSFWHFNNDIPNNTPLASLQATYTHGGDASIHFRSSLAGYPFNSGHPNWRKASMERRNRPTPLNYSNEANYGFPYNESEMRGVQVKQPFVADGGENILEFHFDVEHYAGLRFSFAVIDEEAAEQLVIDYSVSHGDPQWITTGLNQSVFPISSSYQLVTVDFTNLETVDFNKDFKIRVRFAGEHLTDDAGNRVTFNNIMLEYLEEKTSTDVGALYETPKTFELKQNYPNPFNPNTTIAFTLPETAFTELTIYNTIGQRIAQPISGVKSAGNHTVQFNASQFSTGMYIYRLRSGNHVQTRTMLIVK